LLKKGNLVPTRDCRRLTRARAEAVPKSALLGFHISYVITRSNKLISLAQKTGSCLLAHIFTEAASLMYTSFDYSRFNSARHWKTYSDFEKLCASFIRDARMNPG
jgi:hypothetical protein